VMWWSTSATFERSPSRRPVVASPHTWLALRVCDGRGGLPRPYTVDKTCGGRSAGRCGHGWPWLAAAAMTSPTGVPTPRWPAVAWLAAGDSVGAGRAARYRRISIGTPRR
jgi:hypothetical protein